LQVLLHPDDFAEFELRYFPEDWRNLQALSFWVYGPKAQVKLTYRVHEEEHEKGEQAFEDRFNKTVLLRAGWNNVVVDLDEIRRAPVRRTMDMGHISGLIFFVHQLKEPLVLYLDDVALVESTVMQ
jgi:hypothetical protein